MRAPSALRLAGLALVAAAWVLPPGTQAEPEARRSIVLAVTSQLRGSVVSRILEPERSAGGLAHLAVLMLRARELNPDLVLLDTGNALAGAPDAPLPAAASSLTPGANRSASGADDTAERLPRGANSTATVPPILAAMNRLHYDAAVLGERELELTSGDLATILRASAFPWLGANVRIGDAAAERGSRSLEGGTGGEANTNMSQGANSAAIRAGIVVERAGLRLGLIGLVSPGVLLGKEPAIRDRIRIGSAEDAAGDEAARLRAEEHADLVIAVGAGSANEDAERDTGLLEDLPLPNAAGVIADRTAGLDLVIAGRGRMPRKDAVARPNRSYAVPLIEPVPSSRALTLVVLELERDAGRWRVARVSQETQWAPERADPGILAATAGALDRTRRWLAQRLPVHVAGRATRRAFEACAGALGYAAALHATVPHTTVPHATAPPTTALDATALSAQPAPGTRGTFSPGTDSSVQGADRPVLSLLPVLWTAPRWTRRDFGRPLTFGDVLRWFGQDDPLVIAQLTGRQIAQLLEPYVRQMHGWQTPASLVLYPGGLDVALAPQRSEAASLRLAGTPESLQDGRAYSLWMTRYHRFGGGGLAARALIEPDQPVQRMPFTLRDAVLEFLAQPAAPLPDACSRMLSRQPPERSTRRTRARQAFRHPAPGAGVQNGRTAQPQKL
ncbi:MAG: hypothetical protein ACHQZQ_00905 [SAR324 cluster bacterium]